MYYIKLKKMSERLNIPNQNEDIFISFSIQKSRVRVEYFNGSFFDSIYSTDSDLEKVLDDIYNYSILKGFDSHKEDCTISLEGRKLLIFPNPTDFYDSLDEEEVEDFFDGNLNFNDKKFLVEEL